MRLFRWLRAGRDHQIKESAWAFQELNRIAAAEIKSGGEIKPARKLREIQRGQPWGAVLPMRRRG